MSRVARPGQDWLRVQAARSRGTTLPIVVIGLASTAAAIVQAWCLAHLVGPVLLGRTLADETLWAALFAAVAVLRAGLSVAGDARAFEAGVASRRRLRTEFLVACFARSLHRAPTPGQPQAPAAEEAAMTAGGSVTVAIDQVDGIENYFGRWLPAATLAWAGPLLVVLAVLPVDPLAAAALAVGGALVPVGMAIAGIGAAAASRQQFVAMARLQSRFLDRVQGIATIVLAGRQASEAAQLQRSALELSRRTMRVLRVAFLSSAMLDAASTTVLVVLAIRAGLAWRGGTLQPIAAVFAIVLVSEFFAPLRAFAAAYQDRAGAQAAATTLGAMPQADPPAPDAPAIRTVAATGVSVAFEDVSFSWDEARGPVLSGLSFRIPPNETMVLVGPSGSGKSTVIELLLGFAAPASGRITVNGADLAALTPAALSRITAWIGQRPVLFAGSIRDNIRFGQMDAPDAAIEAAADAAGLRSLAPTLPQGLDTMVGEGGYGLSGGQAQRVAIARAFVRNAPLLLLDEPTAHLDPATEADVLESLKRLAIGRTVLMAAHSSAAMALGGRRVVLEHGHVVAVQGAA